LENNIILCAENIHKSFLGNKVLKGVSVQLRKGEIHALIGENGAGKSTLVNIISGVHQPDSGEIYLDGEKAEFGNPNDAQKAGIGLVHQELALCPHVTVGENVFIGRLPKKAGLIDRKKLYEMTMKVLEPFETPVRPDQIVEELSVAQQQIVEIAKALSLNCKVIIFDEPTSSLNESEAQKLLKIIDDIKNKGIGILYISHKLSEIFQITDRITVLRDGNFIETVDTADTNSDHIISSMVGKEVKKLYPNKSTYIKEEDEILRVEHFTRLPEFQDISFSVCRGEVLGLCGLVGAGRTEVSRAICGIDKSKSGDVYLNGSKLTVRCYSDALKNGVCYLSEDRKKDGLFVSMTLLENMMAPGLKRVSRYGLLNRRMVTKEMAEYKQKINIKYVSVNQIMNSLSGGNQQKIMISKLLALKPKLIIMDEPTRGIDVGAKYEIYAILRELAEAGVGVVIISSEMPEIVGMCDRVVIMNVGSMVGELRGEDITQENIITKISEFCEK
jgi:ribose transport system ATP-binding protein